MCFYFLFFTIIKKINQTVMVTDISRICNIRSGQLHMPLNMLFIKLSICPSAVRMRITPRVKSSPTSWRWWSSLMLFCRGEFTCRTHLEVLHKTIALLELSLGSSPCSLIFSFSLYLSFHSVSRPDKVFFPPPNWKLTKNVMVEKDVGPSIQHTYEVKTLSESFSWT